MKDIMKFMSEKSGMKESINHNFARIRIDSYNYLHMEKVLTFHNVIILIKPVVNEKLLLLLSCIFRKRVI